MVSYHSDFVIISVMIRGLWVQWRWVWIRPGLCMGRLGGRSVRPRHRTGDFSLKLRGDADS